MEQGVKMESTCPVRSQQPCPGHSGKLSPPQHSSSFTSGLVFRFVTSLLQHLLWLLNFKGSRKHVRTSHWIWWGSMLKRVRVCAHLAVQPTILVFALSAAVNIMQEVWDPVPPSVICTCFWIFVGCTSNWWFFYLESISLGSSTCLTQESHAAVWQLYAAGGKAAWLFFGQWLHLSSLSARNVGA